LGETPDPPAVQQTQCGLGLICATAGKAIAMIIAHRSQDTV
jgi:hypothetical protein